jgi:hypothetical protein
MASRIAVDNDLEPEESHGPFPVDVEQVETCEAHASPTDAEQSASSTRSHRSRPAGPLPVQPRSKMSDRIRYNRRGLAVNPMSLAMVALFFLNTLS